MFRKLHDSKAIRYTVVGALATALVAGCAGTGQLAKAGAYAKDPVSKNAAKADKGIAAAEAAVLRSPRDAAARTVLGNAYLQAGRFESATTTFQDAIALGDASASTALRLALAQTATGRGREAVVILDMHRNAIPASDYGLALALAGEAERGVHVLAEALRGGENTPKLRQNLAYAYALDGRWAEARMMASQDVPADKLDARISDWAMMGKPEDYGQRVAGLLGTPLRADAGQPVELALGDRPAEAEAVQFAATEPSGELPAVQNDPSREFAVASDVEAPLPAPVPLVAHAAPANTHQTAPADGYRGAYAETAPMRLPVQVPYAVRKPVTSSAKPVYAAKPLRGASHSVQLGSFSSPENAKRAIKLLRSRNPELKNFDLTITPAVVNGKNFWRVAASGFNRNAAFGMCSTVRTRGGGCIAYSLARPLPGAVPARGGGALLARR